MLAELICVTLRGFSSEETIAIGVAAGTANTLTI
jgi:hypothetical protein